MGIRQYGIYIKTYERGTEKSIPIILVFYTLNNALSIEKEFRDLDSVPYCDLYLKKVKDLKDRCRVRLQSINVDRIKLVKGKSIYTDDFIGDIQLINSVPISIEGWFLVSGEVR